MAKTGRRERVTRAILPTRRSARSNPNDAERAQKRPAPPPRPGEEEEVIAVRRVKALELRKAHLSYREIANALGVSVSTAHDDVVTELIAIREATKGEAKQVMDLELQRLDAIAARALVQFRNGNVKAGELALRCLERRSRYLGLDAPTKVAPTDPSGKNPYSGDDLTKLTPDELRARALSIAQALEGSRA